MIVELIDDDGDPNCILAHCSTWFDESYLKKNVDLRLTKFSRINPNAQSSISITLSVR